MLNRSKHTIVIRVPRNTVGTDLAIKVLESHAQKHSVTSSDLFKIKLVIAEALNNILEHDMTDKASSKSDLCLMANVYKNVFFASIHYQGKKFTPPQKDQVNLLATSGRGWMIIRNFCENVSLNHSRGFNTLLLSKLF